LTSQIPSELRQVLVKNILGLSVLETGLKYQFELNDEDRHEVNLVISMLGGFITQLVNFPEWSLSEVKFSEIISQEVSNIYNNKLPGILKRAVARTSVDRILVWNSLIALQTGNSSLTHLVDFTVF